MADALQLQKKLEGPAKGVCGWAARLRPPADPTVIERLVVLLKSPSGLAARSKELERLAKALMKQAPKRRAGLAKKESALSSCAGAWKELLNAYKESEAAFFSLIRERSGCNTMMEAYYGLYVKFLEKCAETIEAAERSPDALDAKALAAALGLLAAFFSHPILAYLKGSPRYFYEAAYCSVLLFPLYEEKPSGFDAVYREMVLGKDKL